MALNFDVPSCVLATARFSDIGQHPILGKTEFSVNDPSKSISLVDRVNSNSVNFLLSVNKGPSFICTKCTAMRLSCNAITEFFQLNRAASDGRTPDR